MTDYIAHLESQRKMIEKFETRTASFAADTAMGTAPRVAGAPVRHGLAEALRVAASRLDPARPCTSGQDTAAVP